MLQYNGYPEWPDGIDTTHDHVFSRLMRVQSACKRDDRMAIIRAYESMFDVDGFNATSPFYRHYREQYERYLAEII